METEKTEVLSPTQKEVRSQLEIKGIYEEPYENLTSIIVDLIKRLGVDLKEREIDYVTRIGSLRRRQPPDNPEELEKWKPRSILMRLLWKTKRDQIIHAARKNKFINSEDVGLPGPPLKIFVNERLTKLNRTLYSAARAKAKEFGFAHCFIAPGGSIFIRKTKEEAAIRVRNLEELDGAFGTNKETKPAQPQILDYRYLYLNKQ